MRTIENATHTAIVDPMMGVGVLILPNPDQDVAPISTRRTIETSTGPLQTIDMSSLHMAGWNDIMRRLCAEGWEALEDEDGSPTVEGVRPDGSPVYSLYGLDPIHSQPSLDQIAGSGAELRELAGLI